MKRLENGLIDGLTYIKDESSGKIDWLKMIPEKYLYINQDKKSGIEKRLNKPFNEVQISEVKDTELVILLQGIRWLLDTRGYIDCEIKLDVATPEYCAATCVISFMPNEEDNIKQTFTGCASAHFNNTKSFYRNYLVEAASNRALCRAVRNFLKINVVSKDELGEEKNYQNNDDESPKSQSLLKPTELLSNLLKEKRISLKEAVSGTAYENVETIEDLKKNEIFIVMGKVKAL